MVRSIDILAKKEYNYEYEEGRIVRATECDIELSGEIVTSKVVVNTVNYFYDSEGRLKTKIITPRGGSARVIYYENNDNGTVVKFTAGSNSVTSHSKTDSFGRKVFDELQIGTGFISRQFSYHAGDITEEHKDNAKLKSTATTQLVSQIVLSDGRTLSYEYDAEERIVSVVDSFEGTTAYTYDALGQLLTETVNGKLVNSMEYDNYGNIVSKNGVAYTYGDTVWKDKLTKVGTQSITYDKQGNPTSYLGHTLTWEKGRQLKSFDSNTYTYNANGIRTSKTVNGVTHTYTLEGTKILREVWGTNTLVPLYDNEDSVCGILYNGVPYYFLKNLQGDVISIVDNAGKSVAKYSYDAWGKIVSITDKDGIDLAQSSSHIANINPFRYRGYYYDTEIAKYYLQSRYYDASVGRFINGDDASFLISVANARSYDVFAYCENDPIIYFDYFGEAKRIIFKKANSTIFTIDDFYIESIVVKSGFEIKYRCLGVRILKFSDYLTFKGNWNTMSTQNVVVVNCHSSPRSMNGMSINNIRNLGYKNIRALILLGCNAGHYDFKWENVAYEFSKKISGCVMASDGTVYSIPGSSFYSIPDDTWKLYRDNKKSTRRINKGWVVYNKETLRSTYKYSITIPSAIEYLKKNNITRFYDTYDSIPSGYPSVC